MAASFIQEQATQSGMASPVTFGVPVTAGSLLVARCHTNSSLDEPGATFSDDVNGAWSLIHYDKMPGDSGVWLFMFIGSAAGALTMTFDADSGATQRLNVCEYGIDVGTALLADAIGVGSSATPDSPVVTAPADSLVIGALSLASARTLTPDAGWVERSNVVDRGYMLDQISPPAGDYAFGGDLSSSSAWAASTLVFGVAGAGIDRVNGPPTAYPLDTVKSLAGAGNEGTNTVFGSGLPSSPTVRIEDAKGVSIDATVTGTR